MRIANIENAIVPREKLVDYLLNPNHPVGGTKAKFFVNLGFSVKEWEIFAASLREHATKHEVVSIEQEAFGVVYIVEGPLQTPRGLSRRSVRTVWIIPHGKASPIS